ncbi:MAG TPA: arylsulfatase [Vitreimonas sp.]|uniref:arylsulfatase n=1 Tax=Vitreimonas sp. TaxID=3069702 RepID=UPI002D554265|nr:arylsulfatase [Vitreimonas sp.]HYD89066.1 arylsulfatase [Vitreimonas sp.]
MRSFGKLTALAAACFAALLGADAPAQTPPRPNFVVIVIDDAGFTDLGAYGGEARTPNIDALAARGAQFTRYYTSPLCAPSRAMLLTGVDAHRTGIATIPEVLPPEHVGQPGYTMRLEPGVTTVATRLRDGGYRTYATGKWHLGHGPGDLPNSHGFDRSLVLDASGADNWAPRSYMPYYADAPWFEDGARAEVPADFYSSELIVDQMIEYLEADRARAEPFFAYVAFQAVHIPVQAPRAFTEHYEDVYSAGWEALRERRWRRAQELGYVPADAPQAALHPSLRDWDELPAEERALYARSMAVHAGMLEAMDHHIGRLIAYLQQRGVAENTIFVVVSDNGPEPSNPLIERGFPQWMALQGYTRELETLGEPRSYVFIGPEFASATAAPGALFKFYTSEGGVHAPLIVAGPGIEQARIDARAFVTDIAPTLLERAGVAAPAGERAPISGRSMAPVLSGEANAIRGPDDVIGIEVSGNAALYRGDYKLVRNLPRYGDGQWRLYDIVADPGETNDLSQTESELFASMQQAYAEYAAANGVLEMPPGYDVQRQVARNALKKQLERHWWVLAIAAAVLVALLWLLVTLSLRLFRPKSA